MSKIESNKPEITEHTKAEIQDFWTRNVNAEKLYGQRVTANTRGGDEYFADLEAQRYRTHTHIIPWIQQMTPGREVLEIGCGIGMDSFQMASHGLKVTGVDLTEVAVETVRQRFSSKGLPGQFEVADATQLAFEDNRFDYVYSFGVLHHTQDTEKSIREVYRVLKPGGEARIMLYHRRSINEVVHRLTGVPFEDKDEACPVVRRFTVAEVRQMFAMFSLVEVTQDYVYGEGYGKVYHLTPGFLYRFLSRHFGWHLMIKAVK